MLHQPLSKVLRTTKAHLSKLKDLGLESVRDLLYFFPRALEERTPKSSLGTLEIGEKNTVRGTLLHFSKEKTKYGKRLGKGILVLEDESELEVVWFTMPYALRNVSLPREVYLVGKLVKNYGQLQLNNPEVHFNASVHLGGITPIYPESPPLTTKWFRDKIHPLLGFADEFGDPLPSEIRSQEELMPKNQAVRQIHFPESLEHWQEAKRRLGFEEIMGIQLRVMQSKILREKIHTNPYQIPFDPEEVKKDFELFPFELTLGQKKALMEILQDFEKDRPMNRLLQGDVGSGKTAVAFLACLQIVKAGFQAALLAPTEILSKQHFANALKFFPRQYRIELLTGSTTAKQKEKIKGQLLSGEIDVIIGTHAILTEDTIFKHLGLAVIDEQHRFGVKQRATLSESHTHLLNMTATPIPRSMALTIYGDQDLSIIREKPAGRKPIITRVVADQKTQTLCERFIADQIEKGYQIFWICPLVEYSEKLDAKNVLEHFQHIKSVFPKFRVNYLHGKMKPKEKDRVMAEFKEKQYDILVSTSVIEVGVDIPNATVMCIENAERFGLSQLHQFRGRIGRNDRQSYCFLMVGDTEDKYKERLRAMEKSNDGFYLSEVDLKLRGAGEVYGTRQSGLPDLKCADLNDLETMQKAREWSEKILSQDIGLENHPGLRSLIQEREVFYQ